MIWVVSWVSHIFSRVLSLFSFNSFGVPITVGFVATLTACGVTLCVVFSFLFLFSSLFCVFCGNFDVLLGFVRPIFVN
jgi:hypothetical protein